MNMRIFRLGWAALLLILLFSCKKEQYVYEVEEVGVVLSGSDKNKEKTVQQYLNILYANLYQTALSPAKLVQLTDLVASIGDKQIAYETIVSKMMVDPEIRIPSDSLMRVDAEAFIRETYNRFYVRRPTQAELTYFINFIESEPNLTAEQIYFSFALSNEYYYY